MSGKAIQRIRRFKRSERGAQLTELAIVLPIFLLLFAATAEFGRFFYEYTTLSKAARAGTRHLITAAVNPTEEKRAKNMVVYGNPEGTGSPVLSGLTIDHVIISRKVTSTVGVSTIPVTDTIQIVGYKHQPLFDLGKLLKSPALSLNVDVKPSVTMRHMLTQTSI